MTFWCDLMLRARGNLCWLMCWLLRWLLIDLLIDLVVVETVVVGLKSVNCLVLGDQNLLLVACVVIVG